MKLQMLLSLAVLTAACGSPAAPPDTPAKPEPPAGREPETPVIAAVDDREALRTTALRLAGLGESGESAEWARHAALMGEIWARVEERHLQPMRAWAEVELALAEPEAPLYYPFGGPDLVSALQFFPAASSVVLVGLEPPGRIPNLQGLEGVALETELERLRGGLVNLAEAGYFVTKRMETDFAAASRPEGEPRLALDGLLPVLYIFLARSGLMPAAVELVELDGEGLAVPMAAATNRTATAVRIRFSAGEESAVEATRSLYYFSRDLSNAGLAAAPDFVGFLRGLGAFNSYMKSASYLLHMDDFTVHKDFLVGRAGTVLQDDSGLPLRDLPSAEWQLRFFGTYTRTLPTYAEWFQEDLRAVYASGNDIPALPFAIGYHSKIGGSCLIWAQRRWE